LQFQKRAGAWAAIDIIAALEGSHARLAAVPPTAICDGAKNRRGFTDAMQKHEKKKPGRAGLLRNMFFRSAYFASFAI
jgi:hypothetical protein